MAARRSCPRPRSPTPADGDMSPLGHGWSPLALQSECSVVVSVEIPAIVVAIVVQSIERPIGGVHIPVIAREPEDVRGPRLRSRVRARARAPVRARPRPPAVLLGVFTPPPFSAEAIGPGGYQDPGGGLLAPQGGRSIWTPHDLDLLGRPI